MITPKPEKVTPEKAEAWLNSNSNNRKLRPGVVERYAADMTNGRWTHCASPIWFYEDGTIADGQHRLWAIVESAKAQEFLIGRGLSKEDGLNIDTGVPRGLVDNARISGMDVHLSNQLISVARGVEEGDRSSHNKSNAFKLDCVAKHREAAEFALKHGPKGARLRNAMINAAIARAWYHEADKDRLAEFGAILDNGIYDDKSNLAAVALRNYMLSGKVAPGTNQTLWRDTFFKAQNAIYYFMRRKTLTVIKRVSEEMYPLRKERKRREA